ncbi:APUM5, partial [Symbiodinium microadriaticum]
AHPAFGWQQIADGLRGWRLALENGRIWEEDADWPDEALRSRWAETLKELELPRLTKRYPELIDPLLFRLLEMVVQLSEALAASSEGAKAKGGSDDTPTSLPQGEGGDQAEDLSQRGPRGGAVPRPDAEPSEEDPSPEALGERLAQIFTLLHFIQALQIVSGYRGEGERCYGQGQAGPTPPGPEQEAEWLEGVLPHLLVRRRSREKETERKEGALVETLQTAAGADRICAQMEAASGEALPVLWAALVAATLPCLPQLSCDPNASRVISKLMSQPLFTGELRSRIINRLRGSLFHLVRDKHGCWIVQQGLQSGGLEFVEALVVELRGRVLTCSRHMYGNFVLQRCIELFPAKAVHPMLGELVGNAVAASLNLYSGRVLQRIMEHCNHENEHMKQILDSLLESEALGRLVTSAHGHNVLRSMLLRASAPRVQSLVAFFLEGDLLSCARNRHASLVLESCLEALCRPDLAEPLRPARGALVERILGSEGEEDPLFVRVALDRFGNYVCQRVIVISQGAEAQRVLSLIALMGPKLRRTTNGRHILQAARSKFGPLENKSKESNA